MSEREWLIGRGENLLHDLASRPPRVLARITEEDATTYHLRCERGWCAFFPSENAYDSLAVAAHDARSHATTTGHAVLVEAL